MPSKRNEIIGRWRLEQVQQNGRSFVSDMLGSEHEFAEHWWFSVYPYALTKGRYEVRDSPSSAEIDSWASPDGPRSLGIYRVEGDLLFICQAPAGKSRPTSFTSHEEDVWTHVYRRIGEPTLDAEEHYRNLRREQLRRAMN